MKIALTGKGGVGKTTISALFARILSQNGRDVILIDADPDMNLAGILGIPKDMPVVPICELKELIAERTETKTGALNPIFKMNPKVDDIPEKYCITFKGIKFLTMGTISKGGSGCACPENTFLKTLLAHLLINRNEWVILDMEAGIEHLGRGTASGVDVIIVVVEPNLSSVQTLERINKLANDLKIKNVRVIANKIKTEEDRNFLKKELHDYHVLGYIDHTDEMSLINRGELNAMTFKGKTLDRLHEILTTAGWF